MQRVFARAALALATCLAAHAALAAPAPQQQNGIGYINGGVGQEEQAAMRARRADYNLLLTFATRQSGAYRSDVQLDITDAKGTTLLSVPNTGPMFYAKLPNGSYRISAAAEGKVCKRSVRIGGGPKEMTLHWENDAPNDPGMQE
jgi:hypothetical protein